MRNHGTPSVLCICIQCGAECHVSPSAHARGGGKFCTPACWYAYRRQYTRDHWWERVDKSGGCWLWTGSVNWFGYGKITAGGKCDGWIGTHIVAWREASPTPTTDGWFVLHTCDVPACVRNDEVGVYVVDGIEYERHGHLWLGTQSANMADMRAKGRGADVISTWWQGKRRDGLRGSHIPE